MNASKCCADEYIDSLVAAPLMGRGRGMLVLDDAVLDKPNPRKMGLVAHH